MNNKQNTAGSDTALSTKNKQLPTKIEDLTRFILVGREKLVSVRAHIRAIDKLGLAEGVREQKHEEASMLAGALLDAETKMGELLKSIPMHDKKAGAGAHTCSLPEGVNKRQSHEFQVLADNKDIVEQVKKEADAADDLPTRTEVLRRVKEQKKADKRKDLAESPLPPGKYRIIYGDPAWKYADKQDTDKLGGAKKHYPLMSIEELCELKDLNGRYVKDLAGDNAILFLWVTSPILSECWPVITAWGFEYKTSFVWDKVKHNMGHYNSVRHEILLVCTKGSCVPDNPKLYDSVQSIERTEHSEKPEEFRKIIDDIYPKGKRIELFARKQVPGWDSWGNQLLKNSAKKE